LPPAGSVTSSAISQSCWIGGGQIGYNFTTNKRLYGIESDFQWTNEKGTGNFLCAAPAPVGGVAPAATCLTGAGTFPPGAPGTTLSLSQALGKRTEKSLGTSDRRQAEILALPLISEHKVAVLAAKLHVETGWRREYEPGLHDGPNGERIAATERELSFYDATGKLLRAEPNDGPSFQLVGGPLTTRSLAEAFLNADFGDDDPAPRRKKAPAKGSDDALLETYLTHNNITGYYEREARDTWATFKSLCDKPLKDCDRDDGRKLVAFYEAQKSKSATIKKRVGWLRAFVNLAIDEGHLKFNPFARVVPKREDELEREKFTDADMRTIKRNLHRKNGWAARKRRTISYWFGCWRRLACAWRKPMRSTMRRRSSGFGTLRSGPRPSNRSAASRSPIRWIGQAVTAATCGYFTGTSAAPSK
jgi:hypothetical protein